MRTFLPCSLLLLVLAGCKPVPVGYDVRDIRGNYALTWDNQLKLALYLGGGVRTVTATGYGNVLDFGTWQGQPLKLDLTQYCSLPEVQCPSEVFWEKVAIDQPNLKKSGEELQELVVINDTVHTPDAGVKAAAVGGLVNANDEHRFVVGLGAGAGASGSCVLLGVSLAGGRFTHAGEHFQTVTQYRTFQGAPCNPDAGTDAGSLDAGASDAGKNPDGGPVCGPVMVQQLVIPDGAAPNGIVDGRLVEGWAGGCAFGPIVAGGVLTLETGFTGTRTGNYDPPPFTPAPVVLPDGGFDGGPLDGG